jgi:hypothetical protein
MTGENMYESDFILHIKNRREASIIFIEIGNDLGQILFPYGTLQDFDLRTLGACDKQPGVYS